MKINPPSNLLIVLCALAGTTLLSGCRNEDKTAEPMVTTVKSTPASNVEPGASETAEQDAASLLVLTNSDCDLDDSLTPVVKWVCTTPKLRKFVIKGAKATEPSRSNGNVSFLKPLGEARESMVTCLQKVTGKQQCIGAIIEWLTSTASNHTAAAAEAAKRAEEARLSSEIPDCPEGQTAMKVTKWFQAPPGPGLAAFERIHLTVVDARTSEVLFHNQVEQDEPIARHRPGRSFCWKPKDWESICLVSWGSALCDSADARRQKRIENHRNDY